MNIFCLESKNFGDAINKIFWSEITKKEIFFNPNDLHYITTGSIMCLVENNSIILGTGFIDEDGDIGTRDFKSIENIIKTKPEKIISVRGPLTRAKFLKHNISCPENYGDPLIIMPCIYNNYKDIQTNIIGIIPHYIDKENINLLELASNLESMNYKVNIIDIEIGDDYKQLIDNINDCNYIISSSLHGIIMGIVYKKKTIPIEFSNLVIGNRFKFYDFFESINIDFSYINIYDYKILNNYIRLDYNNLINIGIKFINLIPFIDEKRKNELLQDYITFYKL